MNEELKAKLKLLRLSNLLTHWNDYLKLAAQQHFSHARLLTHIVEEEWVPILAEGHIPTAEGNGGAKATAFGNCA
jgi:hypothetical protein